MKLQIRIHVYSVCIFVCLLKVPFPKKNMPFCQFPVRLFAVIDSRIRRTSISSFIRRTSGELTAGAVLLTVNARGFLEKHRKISSM